MSYTAGRRLLAATASVALLVLLLFLTNLHVARDPAPPRDRVESMARWLAAHPADWLTATVISDGSLDSPLPHRIAIWRAAHELATRLAPLRRNTAAGYVRGGLFHWYELTPADRSAVLAAAAPLMRDPRFFASVHRPLYQLTRDLDWLRRVAPDTLAAHHVLLDLALSYGLFDDYRELRAIVKADSLAQLETKRGSAPMNELLGLLPRRLRTTDHPLLEVILEELDRRPADLQIDGRLPGVADYALRHQLQPIAGLAPLIEAHGKVAPVTRARLALALDQPNLASQIELTNAGAGSPDWIAYYLDRARWEATKGTASAADSYLARAALEGMTDEVLYAAEEVALAMGDEAKASGYRRQLAERAAAGTRLWRNTCGKNELCDSATTKEYVAGDEGTIRIRLSVLQSDETPPWIEIFVDDDLVAEGVVIDERTFEITSPHGMQQIEVRIANRLTPNGVQRRLRLS